MSLKCESLIILFCILEIKICTLIGMKFSSSHLLRFDLTSYQKYLSTSFSFFNWCIKFLIVYIYSINSFSEG